ncbi:hypothetical protein UPYG_G00075570 [Umbra pygmaea]|uniref:Ferric-chelate reductase 1 n=1 Tax=Umbra pygmaea TaxID=75934 RepID=A0ABD0XCN4_UMBPY
MDRYIFIVATIALVLSGVRCYPSGKVTESCIDMVPQHGSNLQTSKGPYLVDVNTSSFKEGDKVTVTLRGGTFLGFMLQARLVGGVSPLGSFSIPSVTGGQAQLLTCGITNSAVSHTSGSSKSSIQVTWIAPTSGPLNNIQFSATFVQKTQTFWVGVKSSAVTYTGNGTFTGTSITNMPPGSSSLSPISSNGCGSSKVCFSQPMSCDPSVSSNCYFMSAVTSSSGAAVQVEMAGASNGYIAIGFSDDQKMGNDDIYICGLDNNGSIQIKHAFSTGTVTPNIISLGNISNFKASVNNGIISCSFTTWNTISTQRSIGSSSPYYLMLVYGSMSNGNIVVHNRAYVSDSQVNISNPAIVTTGGEPPLVKAHGSLMLISWMTTASLGMIIARYLKGVGRGKGCGNKDMWFVVHMTLMILTVVASSIAFILVFSEVRDWTGGAHPVLGCIVMILALIQPSVAMFRCGPTDKWRFVFNWFHALNAWVIKVLAMAAIFTGLLLLDATDNQWLVKVMGGFVGWEAALYIVLESYRCWKRNDNSDASESTSMELLILGLFFLGNLCFLVALLVGIGMQ